MLRLAGRHLSGIGYEVFLAISAEEALRIFARHSGTIDVLITDVVMPGMSGRQLAEEVRQVKPELPIVYMSGDPSRIIHPGDLPPGMFFLPKPFRAETLRAAVEEARNWRMG